MYGYIYKITNLLNGKIYIGQTTKTLQERFNVHCRYVEHNYKSGSILHKAMKKHGIEHFNIQEIDKAESKVELDLKEKYWIETLDTRNIAIGYNIHEGGTGGKTYRDIKPVTQKQLDALTYGRHLPASEKLRESLSKRRKNCIVSKETREKLRQKQLGRKASPETRQKMSLKHKGKKLIMTDSHRENIRLAVLGRVHIHKGIVNKNVKNTDLQSFLDQGYELGYYYKA